MVLKFGWPISPWKIADGPPANTVTPCVSNAESTSPGSKRCIKTSVAPAMTGVSEVMQMAQMWNCGATSHQQSLPGSVGQAQWQSRTVCIISR